MRRVSSGFSFIALIISTGCKEDSGGPTETGDTADSAEAPVAVDILLVVDTSGSMKEESSAVIFGADAVVDALGDVDWRMALTTTSAMISEGPTEARDPGEAGSLIGEAISPGADAAETLREQLACHTIFWKESALDRDGAYKAADDGSCPLPTGTEVSREYLTCECPDGWIEQEGAGNEEGLEQASAALCLRSGEVPAACFDGEGVAVEADAGLNADFWREDAKKRAVVISDEGDGSRRVPNSDGDPTAYVDLLTGLSRGFRFYVLGPAYVDNDGSCLNGAQTWGVERYMTAAEATGGEYATLTDFQNGCVSKDAAAELSGLLSAAVGG